jgi:drug/metabolite transporter (DMT)-like permease
MRRQYGSSSASHAYTVARQSCSVAAVHDTAAKSGPLPGLSPLILACLAATWLIWGSTYLAIRFALVGFAPFFLMATRFVAAGGVLLLWMRWRGAPLPSVVEWRNALIVGTLMLGCGMGGTAVAELTVGSGLVVAFIAVTPLLLVVMSLAYRVYPRRGEVVGVVVGFAGVLMLTQGAGFRASGTGLAAMVIACSGWSLGSVLSQRGLPLARGAMGFASEMLGGGIVLLALSALRGEPVSLSAPLTAWLAWVYLTTFGSLIAFNAYMVLLNQASASVASSYTYANPVIAMLLGVAIGGERITAAEWLSAGVILVGVVIVFASRR